MPASLHTSVVIDSTHTYTLIIHSKVQIAISNNDNYRFG